MSYIYSLSARGYSHVRGNKPCQDFSSSYQDKERSIITCCDGHGGDIYVRSDRGSKFASAALVSELSRISYRELKNADEDFLAKVRLSVLCAWNSLVENDYSQNPLKRKEKRKLTDEQKDTLRMYPVKAYGTTMAGVLLMKDSMLVISIGDTEVLGVKGGQIVRLFDDEDEPVANITYSMCQEDAFDHIKAKVIKSSSVDGMILCTDGLSSPYQSYDNFLKSFVRPLFRDVNRGKSKLRTDTLVRQIAADLGVGDDVSLAYLIRETFPVKPYVKEDV